MPTAICGHRITTAQNFDRLTKKVQTAFESVVTLRRTYVFDNLIQASAFHAVVAPAIADLQIWLTEGISGYGPRSETTAQIILSRISVSFQKAKMLNRQSRLNAHSKLNEERNRLDRFLFSVNLLFMLTLLITLIMIFLFIRQHLLKNQEIKTQKALQTQRDLLNSLFENILLGITVWDRDGAFLFANKSFTHLTGYTVENIRNIENWFSKAYPDPVYRDRVIEDWEKSTKITNAVREFKITCKNGQVKEIEFRGTFLPDGRALVTLADITRQKQAEVALKESEERFKMAGKASYDLIYEWDVKTDSRNWFGDIDNIIINAHHAMPSGGKIQVTATNVIVKEKEHPILFPGNYVKISISDTGTGIPEKYISRIFDPFFTTKQTGSGLGLATGYFIIKRHGGIIDVESEPGIGTTFHTFIPSAKIQKISEEKIVESRYRGSGRILILDDEEIIQEMLIDMLESLGFTTTSTSEGSQTVQAFKKASKQNNPFRAVILDLTVPGGMGGKKVVKEIRKTDKRIPVFVVSGYSADAAIAKPGEFGFTASLEKPFKVAELTRMFEQHLKE